MDELTRLLLDARDGERSALRAAIQLAQADVWRCCAHLVGRDDADDVTQDTFLRAWRALPAFRGESSGRTWLLAIARRACADWVRGTVRRRRLLDRVQRREVTSTSTTGDPHGEHALDDLLRDLDPDRRAAFVLTQVVGCSYAEAAAICDVPVGTIRSRVARAREDLVAAIRDAEAV